MKKEICLALFILMIFTGCKKEKPQAVYRYYETDGVRVGRMYDGTVLDKFSSYYDLIESEREEIIIISVTKSIKNFEFINVIPGIYDHIYPADVLFTAPELTPEIPFQAMTIISTDIPRRGISFIDDNNNIRYFYILKDSEDNSLILKEFFPFEADYHEMSEPDYYDSGDEKLYPDYNLADMPRHIADDLIYTTWKHEAGSYVYFFSQSFFVDFGEPSLVNVWGYGENGQSFIEKTASWSVSNGNNLKIYASDGETYNFIFYIEDEVLTIIDKDNDTGRFRKVYPFG